MGSTDDLDSGGGNSQQYNFRWHDYPQSVVSTFKNLKEEEDFVDVTLACNSQQFTAHKVVLSACSPYFRKLLKSNPCQHPIVILRDVTEQDLQSLLKFMYNGEVQISEGRLKEFLRTAETLQVRGLTDGAAAATSVMEEETVKKEEEQQQRPQQQQQHSSAAASPALSATTAATMDHDILNRSSRGASPLFSSHSSQAAKRHRLNGPESESPLPPRSASPNNNNDLNSSNMGRWGHRSRSSGEMEQQQQQHNNGSSSYSPAPSHIRAKESLLSQALEKHPGMLRMGHLGGGGGIDMSNNSRGGEEDDDGGSASDTASESLVDGQLKSEIEALRHASSAGSNPLFPPGLEALYRQAGFPSAFLGLAAAGQQTRSDGGSSAGDYQTMSVPQVGLQSHAGNPNLAGKLDMMRVRATDPRPCPKCGKIYRSAHTLRTHMEDKHTICPGYRCVLCGTVAKSRNSLHSHMSRQHRGISTKDLPVVPMPAPFDAGLASRLLAKAGVKVSPNELAARASPTAPRRSDLPKLDSNLLVMQHQQFPLPASNMMHNRDSNEMDDLRVPTNGGGGRQSHSPRGGGLNPKDFAAYPSAAASGMGSALLDTYLSMIAAAGGDTNAMAAAISFQNSRAAAFAAAAAAAGGGNTEMMSPTSSRLLMQQPSNGDKDSSDNEDMMGAGELGSDAENDDEEDMSDTEDDGGRQQRRGEEEEDEQQTHSIEAAVAKEGTPAATTLAN